MSRRVWLSLLVGIGMIAGCASGSDGPSSSSAARVRGNATVRSVVYMAAAPGTTAEPGAVPGSAKADRNPPTRAHRYSYTVELDSGEFRTFGFADDQQLRVGDRVVVSESGVAAVAR